MQVELSPGRRKYSCQELRNNNQELISKMSLITCGWCGTHYQSWRSKCDSCGGSLPPPPGMELGPPPPEAPRALPKGFEFRQKWGANVYTIVGAAFTFVGAVLTTVFAVVFPWACLFTGLFLVGGFQMFRKGRAEAVGIIKAFKTGRGVAAKIVEVSYDNSLTINGKSPYKIVYSFSDGTQEHEGSAQTFDSSAVSRTRGQPIWVLYVENDPSQNTIYPPVR
jgi:hypothetical protein